jgi:endonuclease/exonuclease/phosphatase family metal-dependent hydrolase
MTDTVTIATLNLLHQGASWPRRAPLVLAGFQALAPDVICLQEVHRPSANVHWLADTLGGYEVVAAPRAGPFELLDAVAILTRLPIVGHSLLDLGEQWRTALRVDVRVGASPVSVVTTHLAWSPFDGARQIGRAHV